MSQSDPLTYLAEVFGRKDEPSLEARTAFFCLSYEIGTELLDVVRAAENHCERWKVRSFEGESLDPRFRPDCALGLAEAIAALKTKVEAMRE